MSKSKKRFLLAALAVAVACAVGARIYVVNATAVTFPEEHYPMNQWVDLNGAFLHKISESTQGYSIKVKSARLMSYNDYIREFGLDKTKVKEGFDTNSVLNLEVEMKNEGNDNGSFFIFAASLIPERKDNYLIFNRFLWQESEPDQDSSALATGLLKDTSYTTNIPYEINLGNPGDNQEVQSPITDTSFELIVSNAPVRKIIDIDLSAQ